MTKENLAIDIGRKLEKELKKRGISQNELARRTGLNKSTISRYIKGDRLMTMIHLMNICYVLGCKFSDLVDPFDYVKD